MKHQLKRIRQIVLDRLAVCKYFVSRNSLLRPRFTLTGAPPYVAKRTRIEIRTLTGKSNYVSPQKAEQLFQEKRIIWTDDAHLYATMSLPHGFGDYSNVLTNRCLLTVRQSGYAGPLVVQLL